MLKTARTLIRNETDEEEVSNAAVAIISCAAAVEAVANGLLRDALNFQYFDELKLRSKIELICESTSKVDWGAAPWQSIDRLVRIRNWLMHFKESDIGLINSNWNWVTDDINKKPKIDPILELSNVSAAKYYNATLDALRVLIECGKSNDTRFTSLIAEEFSSLQIG